MYGTIAKMRVKPGAEALLNAWMDGFNRAIREAGLVCPDDIAIVSFDGLVPPDHTVPSLTSVAQPVAEVGAEAATMLHAVISGELTEPESVVLPTHLLVRESCGAHLDPRRS